MTSPSRHRPRSSRAPGQEENKPGRGALRRVRARGFHGSSVPRFPDRSSAGARREGARLGGSPTSYSTHSAPVPLSRRRQGPARSRRPGAASHPRCACSATRSTTLPRRRPLVSAARAHRTHPRPVQNLRSRQPWSAKPRETSVDARESTPTLWTRGSPLIGRRGGGGPGTALLAPPTSPALTLLLCRSRTLAWFPRPVEGGEGEATRLGFASAEPRQPGPRRPVLALGDFLRSSWPFFPTVDWGQSLKAFFFLPFFLLAPPSSGSGLLGGEGKMAGLCEGAVRTRGPECALVRARAGARSCV